MRDAMGTSRVWPVVAGGLGGLSPTLLRIAIDLTSEKKHLPDVSISLIVGMALFGVLGCIVAAIWGEADLRKAFYIGFGLPSMITVATTTASSPTLHTSGAFARSVIAAASIPGRHLTIVLTEGASREDLFAIFDMQTDQRIPVRPGESLAVPENANIVSFLTSSAKSDPISLPNVADTATILTLRTEKNPWYGFAYALGISSLPFKLIVQDIQASGVHRFAVPSPIAMTFVEGHGLYVISRTGDLYVLSDSGQPVTKKDCQLGLRVPAALAQTGGSGAETLLIAANQIVGLESVPYVISFSTSNGTQRTMRSLQSGLVGGIAAEVDGSSVYLTNGVDRQAYSFLLQQGSLRGARGLAMFPDAVRLGALVLDSKNKHLFAMDSGTESVYVIDITARKGKIFLDGLNNLSALAFDPDGRKLYVAQRRVLTAINKIGRAHV